MPPDFIAFGTLSTFFPHSTFDLSLRALSNEQHQVKPTLHLLFGFFTKGRAENSNHFIQSYELPVIEETASSGYSREYSVQVHLSPGSLLSARPNS
jgi:hypothetical protein